MGKKYRLTCAVAAAEFRGRGMDREAKIMEAFGSNLVPPGIVEMFPNAFGLEDDSKSAARWESEATLRHRIELLRIKVNAARREAQLLDNKRKADISQALDLGWTADQWGAILSKIVSHRIRDVARWSLHKQIADLSKTVWEADGVLAKAKAEAALEVARLKAELEVKDAFIGRLAHKVALLEEEPVK